MDQLPSEACATITGLGGAIGAFFDYVDENAGSPQSSAASGRSSRPSRTTSMASTPSGTITP